MENQVLITGASGGIGQAIARAVAKAGYTVVAHYNRNAAPVESLAQQIRAEGGNIRLLQFDICNREQCQEVLEKDIAENGTYYGVVTNAGVCADMAFPAMTGEYWDKVINTNLNGFFNVVHPLVMPMCRKKRGRIITLSSKSRTSKLQCLQGRPHWSYQSLGHRTGQSKHYRKQRGTRRD